MDFDDTLVKTNSRVRYTDSKGKVHTLTPAEYAVYTKKPDDVFDYSDFDGDLIEPASILVYNRIFRNFLKASGERKIAILTARANPRPVRDFLKWSGIDERKVEIIALGDSNPLKKKEWIESQIKLGYKDIIIFDDSVKNINAINTLKREYKDIKLSARLVEELITLTEQAMNKPKNAKDINDVADFFKLARTNFKNKDVDLQSKGDLSQFVDKSGKVFAAFDTKHDKGWVLNESAESLDLNEEYEAIEAEDVLDEIAEKAETLMDYTDEMNQLQVAILQQVYDDMCSLYDSITGATGRERDIHDYNQYGDEMEIEDHLGFGKQYEETEFSLPSFSSYLQENKLLKVSKLSSAQYEKAKKLKDFNADNYEWNKDEKLYFKK